MYVKKMCSSSNMESRNIQSKDLNRTSTNIKKYAVHRKYDELHRCNLIFK